MTPPPHRDTVVSVILPIYNEAKTAGAVIETLLAQSIPNISLQIIIVESNSTDGTREIVRSYEGRPGVQMIFEEIARGKGHAARRALAAATGDIVLFQDADLEYRIEDYPKVLEPILKGQTSFVLGSRHTKRGGMRTFSSRSYMAPIYNAAHVIFTQLLNITLGCRMTDPFTMFKVFRRSCLNGLKFECNRFDFDWELVIKLTRAGHKPLEVPVQYVSRDFNEGKKIRTLADPPTWIRAWWKYAILRRP